MAITLFRLQNVVNPKKVEDINEKSEKFDMATDITVLFKVDYVSLHL